MELAKVLQLGGAGSVLRDGLDDRDVEAARELAGDLMKRLNATRSGRRSRNDDVELDAPGSDEPLRDDANLLERPGIVPIFQA